MEWVLRSPQIHSIFSNLGYVHADGYHVNENCNAALQAILTNILTEDKHLRSYRRSISFGENIKKDLIPLLINAKEDKTIELLTRILVNLTIPIECLLSVEIISKNDFGRHTIFEINNLLASIKVAFTDHRATRVIIGFLKKNVDVELKTKLLPGQYSNVTNTLLLLRNILHIPQRKDAQAPGYTGPSNNVQNQILWNIFSQSIDKILIKLMSVPNACHWEVTMVQLIALLYRDQRVVTLHKLLNVWLETASSESSEDNESNTPQDRGSDDSSPMLTSDPTSDSSDTGGKSQDSSKLANEGWQDSSDNKAEQNENSPQASVNNDEHNNVKINELNNAKNDQQDNVKHNEQDNVKNEEQVDANTNENSVDDSTNIDKDTAVSCTSGSQSEQTEPKKKSSEKKTGVSETSDCGYGTQIENQESNSTSSNDDDRPSEKPVHQKPNNPKQRTNSKPQTAITPQERKRKKIVKRGKSNIINVQGLTHKTPNDDDIANVLKEFTVDFLLKGYNMLVQSLHGDMITNQKLDIDTSHFFWLVTYFLKFATQIELDLVHVGSVLSFEIASYLAAEGVNLCEQFELAIKLEGHNLAPTIRRLHLVATAIREFVQAINEYKKISSMNKEDLDTLMKLQMKLCEAEEFRAMLLLLIRHYNPKFQSKQYLQDLIVTNHILLMFLDKAMKLPEYTGTATMVDHLRQFATPEVMYQYGELLEDYDINGEFVNDCIFTVMHHVVGDLDSINTMYQPKLLKTFTAIWRSDFGLCDDWVDVVQYVLNKFIWKPNHFQNIPNSLLTTDGSKDELLKLISMMPSQTKELNDMETKMKMAQTFSHNTCRERWTEDETSSLNWAYLQSKSLPDVIGEVMKLLKEDGIIKSKESIIEELYRQNTINRDEYRKFMSGDSDKTSSAATNKETRIDDISKLCSQLADDGKSKFLDWVQKVLLDTCHAKIYINKKNADKSLADESKLMNFEVFKKKADEMPVLSAVSYHFIHLKQSVPLVPWNSQQAAICKDLKFLQLLHRLGFHMPVDTGKVFIRIPNFWTADFLFEVAKKISPIDISKLKFSVDEFAKTSAKMSPEDLPDMNHDTTLPNNYYQVHKQTHFATMVNFTPTPGCSYNSEASEIDNHNWLNVVKKSQEFKLILSSDSHEDSEQMDTSVPSSPYLKTAAVAEASYTTMMSSALLTGDGAPLLMPTIMTVKQEISTYSEIYNHSACETASVASDLTRMYVSDEDDKLDDGDMVDLEMSMDSDVELDGHDADLDPDYCCTPPPRKRARVTFASPF